jgi:hypothetical protein
MNEPSTASAKVYPAWRVGRLLSACGWLALAGCSLGETSLLDDPLRGRYGQPVATNASTTLGARGVSDGTATGALPPPNGPTSPAALTNGGTALSSAPAQADTDTAAGVTVGGPRAVKSRLTPVPATSGPATTPQASSTAAPDGSYEQLQEMLRARGVTWQQLKTGTAKDEWYFVCSIPNPHDKNLERNYEARQVGPFGLAAIRATIKAIDDDARGQ